MSACSTKCVKRHGKHRADRQKIHLGTLLALLSMAIGILLLAYPFVSQSVAARRQSTTSSECCTRQKAVPSSERKRILASAEHYNVRVLKGETPLSGIGDPVSRLDDDYMSQLTPTAGSASRKTSPDPLQPMARLDIPTINVHLPIRHGTSDAALADGAGHLYGTSLPVGGKGTNAVLAGHRGLPGALIFTRLDELQRGDEFYLTVYGRQLVYEVDHVWVIDPDDTSHYGVDPLADRVTLLTCTPYGINTQRLVIQGKRIPQPLHTKNSVLGNQCIMQTIAGGIVMLFLGQMVVAERHRKEEQCHSLIVGCHVHRLGHALHGIR